MNSKVSLKESVNLSENRIDAEKGVIYDVALLHRSSLNTNFKVKKSIGRRYSDAALDDTAKLLEGKVVYADHVQERKGRNRPVRPIREQAGIVKGVRRVGEYVRAEQFQAFPDQRWIVERAAMNPDVFGFSFDGLGVSHLGKDLYEHVDRVAIAHSVDLVSKPGSTRNLFESDDTDLRKEEPNMELDIGKLTQAELVEHRPDIVASIQEAALKDADGKTETDRLKTEMESTSKKLKEANEKIDGYAVKEKMGEKKELIEKKLKESKLPEEAKTEVFTESLMGCEEDKEMDSLIKDRLELVEKGKKRRPFSEERKTGNGDGATEEKVMTAFTE